MFLWVQGGFDGCLAECSFTECNSGTDDCVFRFHSKILYTHNRFKRNCYDNNGGKADDSGIWMEVLMSFNKRSFGNTMKMLNSIKKIVIQLGQLTYVAF